jgi:hypothetical protein
MQLDTYTEKNNNGRGGGGRGRRSRGRGGGGRGRDRGRTGNCLGKTTVEGMSVDTGHGPTNRVT